MSVEKIDAEAVRNAALIASQIIEQADDSTKLIALHKYYPTGTAAFMLGFHLTMGAVSAACTVILLSAAIRWVLS